MKTTYIYLVGKADVEMNDVLFLCATKKKAKERFEEARKKLFDDYDRRSKRKHGFIDKKYRNILKNITFENLNDPDMYSIHELPYWIKYKVDE